MKAVKLTWRKIDWDAYNTIGYNYTIGAGVIYAINAEAAMKKCPITEKEGKIEIEEITIEEEV